LYQVALLQMVSKLYPTYVLIVGGVAELDARGYTAQAGIALGIANGCTPVQVWKPVITNSI
jgi:hypothetical protein